MSPVATRDRSTSSMKNGFPSVRENMASDECGADRALQAADSPQHLVHLGAIQARQAQLDCQPLPVKLRPGASIGRARPHRRDR